MVHSSRVLIIALGVILLAVAGSAEAERFVVIPDGKDNLVKFESHAPMESFDGKTYEVAGALEFNPDQIADSVTVLIEVDLTTLDTGIGLRNTHMRENHLETDEFPKAVFRGGRIIEPSASVLGADPVTLQLAGTFELHGLTRGMTVDVEIVRNGDGSVQVVSRFEVRLSDFEISRPKFLMLKLDEVQKITVDMKAIPVGSGPPNSAP